MRTYLDQLQRILDHGVEKRDRTGVGTLSLFGMQARYAMDDGFPAVTTKRLVWKSMLSELLWFVSGSDNINDLKAIYPHNKLWDANYEDYLSRLGVEENDGAMGRIYGVQWRRWRGAERTVDQLQEAVDLLRTDPGSRRIMVDAWNAAETGAADVALPPCHNFFQLYTAGDRLSLQMYQRSCDMFLGVPLNIASYSLLLHMVARDHRLRAPRVHPHPRRLPHLPEPPRRRERAAPPRAPAAAAACGSATAASARSTTSSSTTSRWKATAATPPSAPTWPSDRRLSPQTKRSRCCRRRRPPRTASTDPARR